METPKESDFFAPADDGVVILRKAVMAICDDATIFVGGQPGMVIFVCNGASLRTMIRLGSAAEAMRRLTLEGNPGEEDFFSADEPGRVIVRRDAVVQVEPRGDGVSRLYIKGDREWRCPIESPLSVGEIMRRICE